VTDKGYHSINGFVVQTHGFQEHILYRYGQAKPFILVYYK
jgi:hypothetical protein